MTSLYKIGLSGFSTGGIIGYLVTLYFITRNFYLTQVPLVMDQFSATEIFNTSIRDLPRPRLIQKRRNLLTLLNGDAFYPLSTWPQDIQQLFWKKPIGDTDTFKLMLFFLGNGCSKHLVTEWILKSQHWTTLQKGIKRARKIDFINNNLDSKANIWFYYDIHHSTWLFLNGEFRNTNNL